MKIKDCGKKKTLFTTFLLSAFVFKFILFSEVYFYVFFREALSPFHVPFPGPGKELGWVGQEESGGWRGKGRQPMSSPNKNALISFHQIMIHCHG